MAHLWWEIPLFVLFAFMAWKYPKMPNIWRPKNRKDE